MMDVSRNGAPVVVVGGGAGGLAAAALVARRGHAVTLYEKASDLGGRARTTVRGEVRLNLGPHALYRAGAAARVLGELGVSYVGHTPSASGAFAFDGGVLHTLPGGFVSLVTTRLLGLAAKLETARLLATIGRVDPAPLDGVSVTEWLSGAVKQPETRRLVCALFRVSTYANDPDRMSAGAALRQLQLALASNVLYLDGGWQTLVDGLRATATGAGARIETSARVAAVEHDGAVQAVRLADGTRVAASAVIVAAGPDDAAALAPVPSLERAAREAIPVGAACLDVALTRLPRPTATFALGIDRPLYCSVHSAVARLAPEGMAVIHVAKYLGTSDDDPATEERELESLLDGLQPGWRGLVAERRFLPRMLVTPALVTARQGGTAGRPGPAVPEVRGLFVVGDWTGPEGMLVDASLASARRAADLVGTARRSVAAA